MSTSIAANTVLVKPSTVSKTDSLALEPDTEDEEEDRQNDDDDEQYTVTEMMAQYWKIPRFEDSLRRTKRNFANASKAWKEVEDIVHKHAKESCTDPNDHTAITEALNTPAMCAMRTLVNETTDAFRIMDNIQDGQGSTFVHPFFSRIPTMAQMLLERTHERTYHKKPIVLRFQVGFDVLEKGEYKYICGVSEEQRAEEGGEGFRHRGRQIVKCEAKFHPTNQENLDNQCGRKVLFGKLNNTYSWFEAYHFMVQERLEDAFEMFKVQTKDQDLVVGKKIVLKAPVEYTCLMDVWTPKHST